MELARWTALMASAFLFGCGSGGQSTGLFGTSASGTASTGTASTSSGMGGSTGTGTAGTASTGTAGTAGTGGSAGTAGTAGTGGSAGTAGTAGTGGSAGTAGTAGTGGSAGTAGTAGTGGSAGTATTSSSSSSSGSLVSTPGAVACGTTTCDTTTSPAGRCCLGGASGPVCAQKDCPSGDTDFACDQSADCGPNLVCCLQSFNGNNHYEQSRCLQTCPVAQLCGTQADCTGLQACVSQTCFGQTVQSCGPLPAGQCQ